MDLFAINGAPIDGTSVSGVSASANFVGTATTGAGGAAIRLAEANATVSGNAAINVSVVRTAYVGGTQSGSAILLSIATQNHAAYVDMACGAGVLASVLRTVITDAQIIGTASFIAIPASILGSSDATCHAGLVANATLVLPARATAFGTASTFTASASVTRNVAATVVGKCAFRVEAQQDNKVDAYVEIAPLCNLALPDIGIVFREVAADIASTTAMDAFGTQTLQGYADLSADCNMVPDAMVSAVTGAFMRSIICDFVANATRTVLASATMSGNCTSSCHAYMNYAVTSDMSGTADMGVLSLQTALASSNVIDICDMLAAATAIRMAATGQVASADLMASATVIQLPLAHMTADGTLLARATAVYQAEQLTIAGSADFNANSVSTQVAFIAFQGGADIVTDPAAERPSFGDMQGDSDASALGTVIKLGVANFDCDGDLLDAARLNAEAYDPPERTLRRRYTERNLSRPYTERTFRRAA